MRSLAGQTGFDKPRWFSLKIAQRILRPFTGPHAAAALLSMSFGSLPARAQSEAPVTAAPPAQPGSERAPEARKLEPPQAISTAVEYPPGSVGAATVVLELVIAADGNVRDRHLITGDTPFADAALKAALSWRFLPARLAGRAVAARIRYTVRFEPAEPEPPPVAPAPKPSVTAPKPAKPAAVAAPGQILVLGERAAIGATSVTREEARALPGTFGDPLRAVEAEPGVTPIISGLPYFFVRGAPPANVGLFIDGVDVPLLYHAFLGPSVLHPGLIDRIQLYAGAAPVEYGRFAGPVISATTRPPGNSLKGEASLRLIDAGALVEAPFGGGCGESKEPGCARGHALISGRYSYTGLVLSALSDASLGYWDYQALVSYRLTQRDRLSVFAFGAYDFFDAGNTGIEGVGGETKFHRLDVRWDHRASARTHFRAAVTGGLDSTGDELTVVGDRSIRGRFTVNHEASRALDVQAGFDVRYDDFSLKESPLSMGVNEFAYLFPARREVTAGAFVGAKWTPVRGITVQPGLRADLYRSRGTSVIGFDPRVNAEILVRPNWYIQHSVGLSHQPPNFIPNIPGAQVADLDRGLQRGLVASSGVRGRIFGDLRVESNVFRSAYFNAVDPIGSSRDFSIDRRILEQRSTISSWGIEFKISRPLTRRLGGLLSYTYSRTRQTSGAWTSVSGFDRPHVVQLALGYDFGAGIRAAIRGVYYTGIPARIIGDGRAYFDGGKRGPAYYRLDARAEKRWKLGASGYIGVVAELLNATWTKETLRLDCGGVCRTAEIGPIVLPSLGVEGAL